MDQSPAAEDFAQLYGQVAALSARGALAALAELRHGREHLFLSNGLMAGAMAQALIHIGRRAEALPYAQRAAQAVTDRSEIFHNLSICLLEVGQYDAAVAAFSRTVDFARGIGANQDLPALYATLAADYDSKALHQRIPRTLIGWLGTLYPGRPWGGVLDLGCGTGLVAVNLPQPLVIDGVDLSREMLEQARRRSLYRRLYLGDLRQFLGLCPDRYETILAAGVMNYFGDLGEIIGAAARLLHPGGVLAFATDPLVDPPAGAGPGREFALTPGGEYCHSRQHLLRIAAAAELHVREIAIATYRTTPGFWCAFEKPMG